jgi:hypothetical protein
VSCELLQSSQSFGGFYFGHVMNVITLNEAKIGVGMNEVNLKDVQVAFQKTITWIRKFRKGKHD